jgi:sugar phosphate isomerase/epimerase
VQVQADGEFAPSELGETARRHLSHILQTQRLELVALGAINRRGLDNPDRLDSRVSHLKSVLRLAGQLRVPVVVANVGIAPPETEAERRTVFSEVLTDVANEAARVGVRLAVETGHAPLRVVRDMLRSASRFDLAVNWNPAAMLARGVDPFDGLAEISDAVANVTINDLVRTGGSVSGFDEAPVGCGELDFPRLATALAGIDYRGYWMLAKDKPASDDRAWRSAVEFLRRL